jgi:hypothetical protein
MAQAATSSVAIALPLPLSALGSASAITSGARSSSRDLKNGSFRVLVS